MLCIVDFLNRDQALYTNPYNPEKYILTCFRILLVNIKVEKLRLGLYLLIFWGGTGLGKRLF